MNSFTQTSNSGPPKSVMRWFWGSYAAFFLSLPLPAVEALETPSSRIGQPASCFSVLVMSPVVIMAMPLVVVAEPRLLALLLLPLLTIVVLASPVLLRVNRRVGLIASGLNALLSLVTVALIPSYVTGGKHIGYFVWVLAQLGFVVSCGIGLWSSTAATPEEGSSKAG